MSHVRALSDARTDAELDRVQAVNLRDHPQAFDRKASRFLGVEGMEASPDLVCVTVAGNFHNIFCLMENPQKFRLGDAFSGSVPADKDRRFVPRDLLRAHFDQRLAAVWTMQRALHGHFPKARFAHLSAPPPVVALPKLSDAELAEGGKKAMLQFLAFDAAPAELRLAVWDLQQELCRDQAAGLNAVFLEPPRSALDAEGFLATDFWTDDPTHGNAGYGRLVLDQIAALDAVRQGAAA